SARYDGPKLNIKERYSSTKEHENTRKTQSMPEFFDELQKSLGRDGPNSAIDKLCAHLCGQSDFTALFYALLMKKRLAMGVSPNPTLPAARLPVDRQAEYEHAIREAAHHIGKLSLDAGDIPAAWRFYRMLG